MSVKENLPNLPTDLILQIFSRLPAISAARCRCLSKLWASLLTLDYPYFTELFLTQSRTRPRLLFAAQRNEDWCLYSCLQPQISDKKNPNSYLSITAEFHMSLPKSLFICISTPVSGLLYFSNMHNSPMLCNPSTRHLLWLPQLTRVGYSYFGYDPINKQFSLLAISYNIRDLPPSYQILKLGSGRGRPSWKNIECPLHHHPLPSNTCINGILYYIANFGEMQLCNIVSFDLNSEEFKFIDQPWHGEVELLINFKGKLGGIKRNWVVFNNERFYFELSLWVLEDADKQKWSKHVYNILKTELGDKKSDIMADYTVGVTATGDIVLTPPYTTTPFYVYFFNLEKKTLQKVEIKCFEGFKSHRFYGCVDYIAELRALKWN